MVVVSAYKEKYVRRITRDDLLETIPVLARLEGCAAFLTVKKLDAEQLQGHQPYQRGFKSRLSGRRRGSLSAAQYQLP